MVPRLEVRGRGRDQLECYNGGVMHFDRVALKITCLKCTDYDDRREDTAGYFTLVEHLEWSNKK